MCNILYQNLNRKHGRLNKASRRRIVSVLNDYLQIKTQKSQESQKILVVYRKSEKIRLDVNSVINNTVHHGTNRFFQKNSIFRNKSFLKEFYGMELKHLLTIQLQQNT